SWGRRCRSWRPRRWSGLLYQMACSHLAEQTGHRPTPATVHPTWDRLQVGAGSLVAPLRAQRSRSGTLGGRDSSGRARRRLGPWAGWHNPTSDRSPGHPVEPVSRHDPEDARLNRLARRPQQGQNVGRTKLTTFGSARYSAELGQMRPLAPGWTRRPRSLRLLVPEEPLVTNRNAIAARAQGG